MRVLPIRHVPTPNGDEVLSDIDSRMEEIEDERVELLTTRNQAMQAAATIANRLEELD